jgi:hypothetical protein
MSNKQKDITTDIKKADTLAEEFSKKAKDKVGKDNLFTDEDFNTDAAQSSNFGNIVNNESYANLDAVRSRLKAIRDEYGDPALKQVINEWQNHDYTKEGKQGNSNYISATDTAKHSRLLDYINNTSWFKGGVVGNGTGGYSYVAPRKMENAETEDMRQQQVNRQLGATERQLGIQLQNNVDSFGLQTIAQVLGMDLNSLNQVQSVQLQRIAGSIQNFTNAIAARNNAKAQQAMQEALNYTMQTVTTVNSSITMKLANELSPMIFSSYVNNGRLPTAESLFTSLPVQRILSKLSYNEQRELIKAFADFSKLIGNQMTDVINYK